MSGDFWYTVWLCIVTACTVHVVKNLEPSNFSGTKRPEIWLTPKPPWGKSLRRRKRQPRKYHLVQRLRATPKRHPIVRKMPERTWEPDTADTIADRYAAAIKTQVSPSHLDNA